MNGRFRSEPDNVEILNNLGNALAALGRHDEAVARYEQALALTPDVARCCTTISHVRSRR